LSAIVQPAGPQPKKDFFISYTHEDREWAEWIAWQLEAADVSTVLQAWDFHPSQNFIREMHEASKSASRTIAVLSPSYLESDYCADEWTAALVKGPAGGEHKLVPVRVRPCQPDGILASIIYIDLVGLDDGAARNTLLNGIRLDRSKPVAAPAFPGRPEPSFPGPEPTPTPVGAASPAAVRVQIEVPTVLYGNETGELKVGFVVGEGGADLLLDLDQEAFFIDSGAGPEKSPLAFRFPSPGRFDFKYSIRAKEGKTANHLLSMCCRESSGRVVTRNRWYVAVEQPSVVNPLRKLGRMIRRYPVRFAAAVLTVVLTVGALVYWFGPENLRWLIAQRIALLTHADYLSAKEQWNVGFDDEVTTASWLRYDLAKWHGDRPPGPRLEISRERGFALTKKDLEKEYFYDFDASFTITRSGQTVSWAFRVAPSNDDIFLSPGYKFNLKVVPENGSTTIGMEGFRCDHLGQACEELQAPTLGVLDQTDCAENSEFHIEMRAKGPMFKVWGRIIRPKEKSSAECLQSEQMGLVTFWDHGIVPHRTYGLIAFLDAQIISQLQVFRVGTLVPPREQ
jgi:TIR domain